MIDLETTEPATGTEAPEGNRKKKANGGKRGAHVAPKKTKASNKTSTGKKRTGAKATANVVKRRKESAIGARDGRKTATILELLKRAGGATAKELEKATGWRSHSLRGFVSGIPRKKLGLVVTSTKGDDGERRYSIGN